MEALFHLCRVRQYLGYLPHGSQGANETAPRFSQGALPLLTDLIHLKQVLVAQRQFCAGDVLAQVLK